MCSDRCRFYAGAVRRDEILTLIRTTAREGRVLGRKRFEEETGVTPYEIGRFWPTFGEAVREAGLAPNELNPGFDNNAVIARFVELTAQLGRTPTLAELRVARTSDPSFPHQGVFQRLGTKGERLRLALQFCDASDEWRHVAEIVRLELTSIPRPRVEDGADSTKYGFVYLARGHRGEYKIGHTSLVDRRMGELGALAPVPLELVHEIKTDDPRGVEAYWHGRFKAKRMRGEWFALTAADVRAFKRWRKIS